MEEILDIQDVMSLSTMKQRLEYMSEYMNKRKKEATTNKSGSFFFSFETFFEIEDPTSILE